MLSCLSRAARALLPMLLLVPVLATAAAPRLETIAPADADIVILLNDVPALLQDWPDLLPARVWNDPQVQDLLRSLSPEGEVAELPAWFTHPGDPDAAASDPHLRLLHAVTGQVVVTLDLDHLDPAAEDDDAHGLPAGVTLLAQVDGNEDVVAEILSTPAAAPQSEGAADTTEAAAEEELMLAPGTWRVSQGVLLVTSSAEDTAAQAAALEAGSQRPVLAGRPGFQAMRRHTAGDGIEILFDVSSLVARMESAIAAEADSMADNPLGVTPQGLIDGLALDVLEAGWLSLRPAVGTTDMTYGITFSEERGLVRLLAFQPLAGADRPPLPADAVDAGAFGFDMAGAWQALMDVLTGISPTLGAAMDAQITQMSAQLGIDLVKEIPGAFAGAFATASFLDEDVAATAVLTPEDLETLMSQVWVASLRPGHRMNEALAALTPLLGAAGAVPETRTVEGRVLNVIPLSGGACCEDAEVETTSASAGEETGPVLAWSVGEKYLVAGKGDPHDVVAVLNLLDGDGRGIWERAEVRAVLDALPAGAVGVSYQDSGRLMGSLVGAALAGAALGGDEGFAPSPEKRQEMAELAARFLGASGAAAYRTSGEFVGRGHLIHGTP